MSDHSGSSEIKAVEKSRLEADCDHSAWLVDSPTLDATFMTAGSNIVLSCPPSWIHADPTDYERLSEGESSDDSSQIGESIHKGSGSGGALDSEFIIPPFSSSPGDPFYVSPQDKNALLGSVYAHISTPLLSPRFYSPTRWSFPRRGPFLVSIDSQNPASPASLSMTTLSPMSSRSISFQPSQTSERDLQCGEDHPDNDSQIEHFASKLHDLLEAVQRDRRSDGYSRRLFCAPSEESQQDAEIGDVQDQFAGVEYHPYLPARAAGSGHSSVKRKRTDSRSGLDDQEVFRASQDYIPFGRYRLIKRAASYQASMFGNERVELSSVDTPISKRRKMSTRPLGTNNAGSASCSPVKSALPARDGPQYSSRTASFRRAESLRVPSSASSPLFSPRRKREVSKPSRKDDKENLPTYAYHAPRRRVEIEAYTPLPPAKQRGSGTVWVPTVPSTPSEENRQRVEDIITPKPRRLTRKSDLNIGLQSPVPIIAPPKDFFWRIPLTPSTQAKHRLRTYLERERRRDKRFKGDSISDAGPLLPHEIKIYWERSLGLGRKTREDCVAWLLTVLPGLCPKLKGSGLSPETHLQSITTHVSSSSSSSTSTVTQEFDDPESELDFTLTQFLGTPSDDQCDVCNPENPEVSINSDTAKPSMSKSARSKTSPENDNKDQDMTAPSFNLSDQLQHSPETRFHAVWMFLRYFWLIDYGTQSDGFDADGECVYPGEDTEEKLLRSLLIWDAAVGSLALSIKLHRDFLDPLLPVYADEYLDLAPHSIRMEDFENAQRDIFSALDYMLGDTPQPIMDELWRALPSLRQLLDSGSGKRHGWAVVMRHAWDKLFACLTEPDVLQFSVSHLTTVALMDSVLYYVKTELLRESVPVCGVSGNLVNNDRDPHGRGMDSEMEDDEALGVLCDIQSLVGFTDGQIQLCRLWMQRIETPL